jgi:AcrR family transcriptional regulator
MNPSEPTTCSARDRVLDAAEHLVASGGGANLTLDAVAQSAGVSKGGLLYHFPNKDALLAAMIERHVDRIDGRCGCMRSSFPGACAGGDLKAWVLGVLQVDPALKETGAALFAVAANNPALLDGIRRRYAERVAGLAGATQNFALAATVMLAVDGLMLAEAWRMSPFSDGQRAAIVDELLRLTDQAFGSAIVPENNK